MLLGFDGKAIPRPVAHPSPKGTNDSAFLKAVAAAHKAYQKVTSRSDSKGLAKATALWNKVAAIEAEQYRLAYAITDSEARKKAIAALDKQFGGYFQHEGVDTTNYNNFLKAAKREVQGETPDQRKTRIALWDDETVQDSSKPPSQQLVNDSVAATKADINAQLLKVKPKGPNGAYTADQIQQATKTVIGQGMDPAAIVKYVASGMEAAPSETEFLADLKNGPAKLQLTPAEQQLAKIDPVTLAFLRQDGIKITQLTPEMASLAKQSPALFAVLEVNHVNISTYCAAGKPQYNLGGGMALSITDGSGKSFKLPNTVSAANVVAVYQGAEKASPGTGVVAVANMLLPHLTVDANTQLLMTATDGVRARYAGGQLSTLLAGAPSPAGKDAAGYITKTINPFLTTQLNGFFTPGTRQNFWANAPAVSGLQGYLQTALDQQFQPNVPKSLSTGSAYFKQLLSGASPEEAKMLIGLVEGQFEKLNLNNANNSYEFRPGEINLLSGLSQAVQIADQIPGAKPGAEAAQVASWINSPRGVQLLNGAASTLYDQTAYYGNSDLADALVNSIYTLGGGKYLYKYNVNLGGILSDNVQSGEKSYDKQFSSEAYKAFEGNKSQTLSAFYSQFPASSGVGVQISASDTKALTAAIAKAYGFTPAQLANQNSQESKILTTDLSWIQSQADPGATVTVLPYMFVSSTAGVQNGVFFDIINPPHDSKRNDHHTTQVLIDGSAAQYALAEDPNVWQHPQSSDVKWHYSSYRDFQLSNDMYQGGTIYTLPGNPLGIGSDGKASSATDAWKITKSWLDVGVGIAAIAAAPFSGGVSLALGAVALGWGTYEAVNQYQDFTSHGEHFGWSNPSARWAIVGDTALAANFAALGVGGVAAGFTRTATRLGESADALSSAADFRTAMTAGAERETAEVPAVVADGEADITALRQSAAGLRALANLNAGIGNGLRTGSNIANYGFGAVLSSGQLYSLATNWGNMSWSERGQTVLNIGMGFAPIFTERAGEAFKKYRSRRDTTPTQSVGPARFFVTDSFADTELPGVASSLAGDVETDLRTQIGSWIADHSDGEAAPLDLPSVAAQVRLLNDTDFESSYVQAGGEAADIAGLNAFIVTDPDGTVRLIAVREDSENRQTLTHELLHAYASPQFKAAAQSVVVDPTRAYSNLSEGAVDFLVSQFMGDDWQGPPSPEAYFAERISKEMGGDAFYRAFFQGDEDALNTFRNLAGNNPWIRVYPEGAPNTIEAMTSPTHSSPADQLEALIGEKTDEVTAALLSEHQAAPTPDASPLAFLIEGLERGIRNAAHQPDVEAAALDVAQKNTARHAAFRAISELAQGRGTTGKIIQSIDADAVADAVIAEEFSSATPDVQASIRMAIKADLESLSKSGWKSRIPGLKPKWQRSAAQGLVELAAGGATRSLSDSASVKAAAERGTPNVEPTVETVWSEFLETPEGQAVLEALVRRQAEATVRRQAYGGRSRAPTTSRGISPAIDRVNDAAFDGRSKTLMRLRGGPKNVHQTHVDALVEDAGGAPVRAAGASAALDAAYDAGSAKTVVNATQDAANADAVKHLTDAMAPLLKARGIAVAAPIVERAGLTEPQRIARDAAANKSIGTGRALRQARKDAVSSIRTNLTSDAHDILDRALTGYAQDVRTGAAKPLPEGYVHYEHIDRAATAIKGQIEADTSMSPAERQRRVDALPAATAIAIRALRAQTGTRFGLISKTLSKMPFRTLSRIPSKTPFGKPFKTWQTTVGDASASAEKVTKTTTRLLNSTDKAIGKFTRSTTRMAANGIARQVDLRQGAQKAGEQSIVRRIEAVPGFGGGQGAMDRTAVARSTAGSRDASRGAMLAARDAAASAFAARLPEVVFGLNFRPNPEGLKLSRMERVVGRTAEPFMRLAGTSYTAATFKQYQEAYGAFLPEILQTATTAAGGLKPDQMTMMLAELPGGIELFPGDAHGHPSNYAQTGLVKNLVARYGKSGRGTIMGIPQNCGGPGHYSTAVTGKLTMAAARALDAEMYRQWSALPPEQRAQADITMTGFDFADAASNPGEYLVDFTLNHPHVAAVGEVTSHKELVYPGLGQSAWEVDSPGFRALLATASKTGHVITLHCDWGDHALSLAGRAAPGTQHYENLAKLKAVLSQYPDAHVVLAHTGIGRMVRPDSEWVDPTTGKPVSERDPNGVPAHIYQITKLFEAVPNARVDISWNDVTQAYDEMRHSNPRAAGAIVKLFREHGDRIMFGTDTVKPVNKGHFNQALMLASPLMMDVLRADMADFENRNPGIKTVTGDGSIVITKADRSTVMFDKDDSAAWKILRGTYDKTFDGAYDRVAAWQDAQRRAAPGLQTERDQLRDARTGLQNEAWADFKRWSGLVAKSGSGWSHETRNAPQGVYAAVAQMHPDSIHLLPDEATQTGRATAGGDPNDSKGRRRGAAVAAAGGVVGAGGVIAALDIEGGHGVTTSAGGGWVHPVPGSGLADGLNSGFFDVRAGINIARTAVGEKLRLQWEQIFEQGQVSREGLNRYVSRLFNASSPLHVTELQRVQISAVTEQFWANYKHLSGVPLDESRGWTPEHKFNVIMGEVGRYQITVNRILTMQDSSISPLDARRPLGKLFNGLSLASYTGNLVFTGEWAAHLGPAFRGLAMSAHPGWSTVGHVGAFVVDAGFHLTFGAANAMQLARTAGSFFGGVFGITGTETNKWQKGLQRWSLRGFTLGGGLWAGDGLQGAAYSAVSGNWVNFGWQLGRSALDVGFTYGSWRSYRLEARMAKAQPMPIALEQATPAAWQNLPLAGDETSRLGQQAEPGVVRIALEGTREVLKGVKDIPHLFPHG